MRFLVTLFVGISHGFIMNNRLKMISQGFLDMIKDSYMHDESMKKKLNEMRQRWNLDNLTSADLRAQLKARRGSFNGLYEKSDLINMLAFLLVKEQDQEYLSSRERRKEQTRLALALIEKKWTMRLMTDADIIAELNKGGAADVQLLRNRAQLETALALLRTGDPSIRRTSGSSSDDNAKGFTSRLTDFRSDVLKTVSTINREITMTDAEKKASDILTTQSQSSSSYSSSNDAALSEDDITASITALAATQSFDDTATLCASFSRQLLLLLLQREYGILPKDTITKNELVNLLSDSVILRRKIVQSYSSNGFTVIGGDRNSSTKSSPRLWSDMMLPEKQLLVWFFSNLKRAAASVSAIARQLDGPAAVAKANVCGISAVLMSMLMQTVMLLGKWAAGRRENAAATVFAAAALTMVCRRGVVFFLTILSVIRVCRRRIVRIDHQ